MPNKPHLVKCSLCGVEFELNDSTWRSRLKINQDNPSFYCKNCKNKGRSIDRQNWWNNLSEEERAKKSKEQSERTKKQWASYSDEKRKEIHETFSNAQRQHITSMTEEEKAADKKARSERAKHQWDNMSEEDKEKFRQYSSERLKKIWANMSDEQRNDIRRKQSEGLIRYIKSLSPEEKAARDKRLIEGYANLSQEKKEEIHDKLSKIATDRYELMSDSEREAKMESIHKGFETYFSDIGKIDEFSNKMKDIHINRSQEDKVKYILKMNEWRNSLTPEEKVALDKKRLLASSGNTFEKNFMNRCEYFGLNELFIIYEQFPLVNKGITHLWDCGIFDENGELIMVVDLDGAYYHADICDYNGIHSREEYDLTRSLSVPDNVIIHIIHENSLKDDFDQMVDLLQLSYKDFVNHRFNEYRMMPFPEPSYNDQELMKSFNILMKMKTSDKYHANISVNTREGDRLCLHFHRSIWSEKVGDLSPIDSWYNDDILKNLIIHHIIYQDYSMPNKILQGFNIPTRYQRVQFMSGGRAKIIISRYLMKYNEIFDPFSGYSGRMLGAISLGKKYIGSDNSEVRRRESNTIIEFLRKYAIKCDIDILPPESCNTEYPCMFTEVHDDDEIGNLMKRYKCSKYIFISDSTEKYKSEVVDVIHNLSIKGNDQFIIEL